MLTAIILYLRERKSHAYISVWFTFIHTDTHTHTYIYILFTQL
jgi:hypothetical protein